ncbi:methylated-DNA--[protein]-cysteine S-methyltransferase [Peribacillus huizhouensis]|uniref:Methylated-DNA-[protein]-cysteine S-methyltransferase n=1 Tax=Peribacillus huizhouensis TaxID=1501239 RepID=A0ABR6CJ44_9BACI|nr:methylated-DNA--[protein]-cysteine S-methyltransferase [Peribacillus huizhouensis]MBA9025072.1 methylated-DNA-[protein]-cysteine S-methyltransferase [Peribacillus huizhouensis]
MTYYYTDYHHPFAGDLYLLANEEQLVSISFGEDDFKKRSKKLDVIFDKEHFVFTRILPMLTAYLSGEVVDFPEVCILSGTEFQRKVWEEISRIPRGETRTYSEIAVAINRPNAVRAVGQASRANPLPFIIPCHRVVGKNGTLTGYAGSRIHIKELLLKGERITQ